MKVRELRGVEFTTPEKYIDERIKILEEDFLITLTDEEKDHLQTLKTEMAIDAAIRSICKKRWFRE